LVELTGFACQLPLSSCFSVFFLEKEINPPFSVPVRNKLVELGSINTEDPPSHALQGPPSAGPTTSDIPLGEVLDIVSIVL